jgi:hypothetical protein
MRLLALILASSLASCAFATTRGPEDRSGRSKPECTISQGPAKLDVAIGTGAGLLGIVSGIKLADDYRVTGGTIVVAGIASIVAFYTSATIGYVRAKRCKEAFAEWNFRAPDSPVLESESTDN